MIHSMAARGLRGRLFAAGALALLATMTIQSVDAFGQMVPYNGSACNGYINYDVWLPDGTTIDSVEKRLVASGLPQATQLIDPCRSTYMAYMCSAAYPRPVRTGQTNSFNVLFACKSTCERARNECKANIEYLNQTKLLLPDCSAPIPNTDKFSTGPILYQNDNSCNAVPFKSSNQTCVSPLKECVSPFVVDLVFKSTNGLKNTDDLNCDCGCCLPCPQTNAFYKPGLLDKGFFITDILKGVSGVLSFVLAISYVVLPGKLQHPSNLIFYAAVSTGIFMMAVAPSYGDPRRVQCAANGIEVASSHNNIWCTAQGAWLLFGAISTTAWLSIVIVNLHLHTVWNSSWLSQRAWFAHTLGWLVPAAFAVIAVLTKSLGWNNSNMCMATADTADVLLFIPLGAIMIPSTLLHMATFVHIIKITIQAERSETVSHSTLSSGRAARISHRRHVLNAIRIQWRAAVLAMVVCSSILIYWTFYVIEGSKTDLSWMNTWKVCILTRQGSQEECGNRFATGHVPDFLFMMITEGLVSTTGLWIFLLFFKKTLMMEWRDYMAGWICCGGRNRRREAEQFYVI